MTTHYIRAPGQDFVVVVPRTTARDARLSYRARGVLARLLSNAEGYSMSAVGLAQEGREGRDAIRAALRELKDAGYIIQRATTNAVGRFTGTEAYVFAVPQAQAKNREPENPLAGNPPAEKPALKSSKSKNLKKEKSSSKAVGAAALGDKSPEQLRKAPERGRRRRTDGPTGVIYWLDDEPTEIERLVVEFGLDRVRSAAAEIRRKGHDPLPGAVAGRLVAARRAEVEEEARRARRQGPSAAERAEDARKARETMAACYDAPPCEPRTTDTRSMAEILQQWRGQA